MLQSALATCPIRARESFDQPLTIIPNAVKQFLFLGASTATILAPLCRGTVLPTLIGVFCGLVVAFHVERAPAQTWQDIAASEDWMHDFTALTMAPDGAWGAATEPYVNLAIAKAIARCKDMSGAELGCGAYLAIVRAGWALGFRCGSQNILVADKNFDEAKRRAVRREVELRTEYVPDMPECVGVVTVDPSGRVMPQWPMVESTGHNRDRRTLDAAGIP